MASISTPRGRAEQWLTQVCDKLLQPYDYDEASNLALEKFATDSQDKAVVLVGEVSRGKSALASALVGQAGASPDGVDFTTSSTVALGPSKAEATDDQAVLFYSDRQETVSPLEIPQFVTTTARQWSDFSDEVLPTRVYVPVNGSKMGDATVVDTPGIGGIEHQHAALAHNTAQQATVLVVVVDASAPISKPEMDFIRATGSGMGSIVVAVTKTDKHSTGFRDIVEKDREILLHELGREIPVFPVSSVMATYEEDGDPQLTEVMQQASGIEELRQAIDDRLKLAENLPAINGIHVAVDTLRELENRLEREKAVAEKPVEAANELDRELERLKALQRQAEQWEPFFNSRLVSVQQNALDHLDSALNQVRSNWTQTISTSGMKVLRKDAQYFTGLIEADLQKAVVESVDYFLAEIKNIVEEHFDVKSEVIWASIEKEIQATLSGRELQTAEVKSKREGVIDPMMLMMGISGGTAIGAAIGTVISFTGLGAFVGVSWVTINVGFRAMRSGKNNLTNWIRESTGTAKTFASRLISGISNTARPIIVVNYRRQLQEQITEVKNQLRSIQHQSQIDEASRQRTLKRLENNLSIIRKNITRGELFIEQLESFTAQELQGVGEN